MNALEPLSLTRLANLEFGQHIKSIKSNIDLLGDGFITDNVMITYLAQLGNKSDDYDKAMKYIAKSDETAKITAADVERDNLIVTLQRQLSVFEYTKNEEKRDAYLSLTNLFNVYKGLKNWNYEEESNGIDNLIVDMESEKYEPHATLLGMTEFMLELKLANDKFKTLFNVRTQEFASKENYNVKEMRKDIGGVYTDFCNYVLSMSKALNTEQYNQTLSVINVVRKYYADRLASRPAGKKGETPEPIPPMEVE